MKVTVKLFATLKEFAPIEGISGTPFDLELPDSAKLGDVVSRLNLPVEEVKIPFVNGVVRPFDWEIKAGDEIGIFPPVGGG